MDLVVEALRPAGILVWDGDEFAEDPARSSIGMVSGHHGLALFNWSDFVGIIIS